MLSKVFGWRGAAFVFGWIMVVGLATKLIMNTGEEMFTFNPYKILGVEEGAEMSAVKKAYRRLSLQYHVRCLPASLRQQEPPLLSRSQNMTPLLPASAPRMARRRRAGQLSFALRSALVRVHGVWAADSRLSASAPSILSGMRVAFRPQEPVCWRPSLTLSVALPVCLPADLLLPPAAVGSPTRIRATPRPTTFSSRSPRRMKC